MLLSQMTYTEDTANKQSIHKQSIHNISWIFYQRNSGWARGCNGSAPTSVFQAQFYTVLPLTCVVPVLRCTSRTSCGSIWRKRCFGWWCRTCTSVGTWAWYRMSHALFRTSWVSSWTWAPPRRGVLGQTQVWKEVQRRHIRTYLCEMRTVKPGRG